MDGIITKGMKPIASGKPDEKVTSAIDIPQYSKNQGAPHAMDTSDAGIPDNKRINPPITGIRIATNIPIIANAAMKRSPVTFSLNVVNILYCTKFIVE